MSLLAQATAKITNPAAGVFGTGAVDVTFANLVVTLWRTAITLGGLALLIMLIMGGLQWILAGGDKGKVEAARERMTQAVIGMFVLVGTVGISVLVGGFLGINLLQPKFANNIGGGAGGGGGTPISCAIANCPPPLKCSVTGVCVP